MVVKLGKRVNEWVALDTRQSGGRRRVDSNCKGHHHMLHRKFHGVSGSRDIFLGDDLGKTQRVASQHHTNLNSSRTP